MLEFSAPESLRAEIEYRRSRATELARPAVAASTGAESEGWLRKLFHRHPDSDPYDEKAARLAA